VGSQVTQTYGGNQTTLVGGPRKITTGVMIGAMIGGNLDTSIGGSEATNVALVSLHVAGGPISYQASSLDINAYKNLHIIGLKLSLFGIKLTANGRATTDFKWRLALKGASISAIGVKLKMSKQEEDTTGAEQDTAAIKQKIVGVLVHSSGIHIVL